MTSYQEVFERKEVKYRLDAAQHHAMLAALEGRMAVDDYGTTSIVSRYFDTPDRALIERSLDKPLYKEKLRVRSYGIPGEDDQVFVELKKKYQGIVYKRRVGCSYAAARAYMDGMPYEQACREFPLPDSILAEASLSSRSLQIAREIDAFKERYTPLRASMVTICDRTAYAPLAIGGEGSAGKGDAVAEGACHIPTFAPLCLDNPSSRKDSPCRILCSRRCSEPPTRSSRRFRRRAFFCVPSCQSSSAS